MIWSRLDDTSIDHPKILGLSDKAFRLWVSSIVYCSRHLTDGHLSDAAITLLGGHVRAADAHQPRALVEELVSARLWDRAEGGGLSVHDYLDYHPSRAGVLAERARKARAGRKGGRRSGERRREGRDRGEAGTQAGASAPGEAPAQARASGDSEAEGQAGARGSSEPRPPAPTEQGGSAAPPAGAAGAPPDTTAPTGPPEISGLAGEALKAHQERTRRRIGDALGGQEAGEGNP